MFDYLKCDYPLPVPEVLRGDKKFSPNELEFQTFSFSPPSMDEYEITEDGLLYRWKVERYLDQKTEGLKAREKKRELSRQDHTGEILFHSLYMTKAKDYFLEYKVLFWKGEVKEVELDNVEEEDSKVRKNAQKKLNSYVRKVQDRQKRWWFPFYKFVRNFVGFVTSCIRGITGWVFRLTWKIDEWLAR
mgnify:CR=1 FL=1|tara:strand:+ start:3689 stop:4252 length:564 start_codon:yes stop_codon:yes gene_type:complete